jgi:hypothetical protein
MRFLDAFSSERLGADRTLWVAAAAVAALLVLFLHDPARTSLYPRCPFLLATGLYCPGCGTLRALHQLLHGEVAAAFGYNSLAMLTTPFIAYAFLSRLAVAVRGKPLPRVFLPPALIWLFLVAVIAFGVLRNIPGFPFELLAPTS